MDVLGTLPVAATVADLRAAVGRWRAAGERVALVPTMGALHRGHLALIDRGRQVAARVVASIFVNPAQFGPDEDFTRYPRDLAADARLLESARCDLLYAPRLEEIYPEGFGTTILPGPAAEGLCGPFRPGHFAGVATVVVKLLLQSQADAACFGEKDYQQLQVVRHVVRDLDIPVAIEAVPTVREPDGLALSSRNRYLSPEHRRVAPALYRVLRAAAARIAARETGTGDAIAEGKAALQAAGFGAIDYLSAVEAERLQPLARLDRPGRLLAAAWLGKTRLIDNVPLPP